MPRAHALDHTAVWRAWRDARPVFFCVFLCGGDVAFICMVQSADGMVPQHCQRAFSLQIKWFEWLDQCFQETDDCGSSQRGQSCVSVHVLRAPSASTRACPSATCAHTTATLIHELATVVVSIMWLRAQHACSTCVCVVTPSLCMRRNMAVHMYAQEYGCRSVAEHDC